MLQLTCSQIRYLHVIYKATKDNNNIRSVDIAKELGITKVSVCRMIKILANMDLITVKERGNICLTAEGENTGNLIHHKLAGLCLFFTEHLELTEPEATDSAHYLLAGLSEHCIDKLLEKEWGKG